MIYIFDDYDNFTCDSFVSVLPEKRQQKYSRLKSTRDKENCLISYLILKLALKNEFGITDFSFEYGENGKPKIKENPYVHFNISHCRSGIAVAVSDKEVGVDIQDRSECNPKLVKRFFSDEESEYILSSDDCDEKFISIWTLKESIIKCFGKNLSAISDYSFEDRQSFFNKYNNSFSTFYFSKHIVSVCSKNIFKNYSVIKASDILSNKENL